MCFTATSLLRTIPTVFTRFICFVRFLTSTAVPATVRTLFAVHQMPFFACFAKPCRFARFVRPVRFGATGTKPNFLCVIAVLLLAIQSTVGVLRSARRTTPGILSKGIFVGMNRVARSARPAPVFTGHQQPIPIPPPLFRPMNACACVAPPGRLPNAEFVRFGFFRTNRLLMLHLAHWTKPRRMYIRNGKPSDDRRRKQL